MPELVDKFNRKIDYLRISVTDRCNLRCIYCMPGEGIEFKSHQDILTYEEITIFARHAVQAGISKIRLTGGEPLVRRDIVKLIEYLSSIPDLKDMSLTTNGVLLVEFLSDLVKAGLKRINISIDSLDDSIYQHITRVGDVNRVKKGLESALRAGLNPVKVNVVVLKGINDDLKDFVKLTFDLPAHVRFIEYMPFSENIKSDFFVSCETMRKSLKNYGILEEASLPQGAGPARYFKIKGALGTLGFISPMSNHFCAECNRLRLTADGRLRTCLFSDEEIDLRDYLRGEATAQEIEKLIRETLSRKPKDHLVHQKEFIRRMYQIGG